MHFGTDIAVRLQREIDDGEEYINYSPYEPPLSLTIIFFFSNELVVFLISTVHPIRAFSTKGVLLLIVAYHLQIYKKGANGRGLVQEMSSPL